MTGARVELASTVVSPAYTRPTAGGSTIELSCHNGATLYPVYRMLLPASHHGLLDSVTPGSWRGFVQDFLKPMRHSEDLQRDLPSTPINLGICTLARFYRPIVHVELVLVVSYQL